MKKVILISVLSFLIIFSGSVLALDYELVGGGIYTSLELTDFNDNVEQLNNELEEGGNLVGYEVEKMDKINSALGFYGGVRFNTSNRFFDNIEVTYERFAPGTGTSIDYSDQYGTLDLDMDINITINGLVATLSHKVNEYISLKSGVGYYFGATEATATAEGTGAYSVSEEQTETNNLNGFGYKIGAAFDYALKDNENNSLFADINYRILELKFEEDEDNTVNANGVELRVGISHKY